MGKSSFRRGNYFLLNIFLLLLPLLFSIAAWSIDFDIDDVGPILDQDIDRGNQIFHSLENPTGVDSRTINETAHIDLPPIDRAFFNIDELFSQAIVKYQPVNDDATLGPEKIATLSYFLGIPHDPASIIDIIEKTLARHLSDEEKSVIQRLEAPSLPTAVRALWQTNAISDKKAQSIILHNAPMSSQELIRLVENGIAKSKSYLVQLRTGSAYGDTLKLFDTFTRALNKVKTKKDKEILTSALSRTLAQPLRRNVVEAFDAHPEAVQDIITDAHIIREMRRHFLFVSSLGMPIRFRPGDVDFLPGINDDSFSSVNPLSGANFVISPRTLSAILIGNYYINNLGASFTNALFVNPLGLTYGGSLNFDGHGSNWWLNYSEGFLGGGASYTVNFDQGAAWSNGQPTFLTFGAMVGGWRNNLAAGISVSSMLSNGLGIGASAQMSISREHDVIYLGEYPLDGKFSAIRGMHKIEIDDCQNVAGQATIAMNFSQASVPIAVAFRAAGEHKKRRRYRTHVNLKHAQRMLSEADVPGVLYLLGKKIKETRFPSFENPQALVDGDELLETKVGKLSGAFVIGLESLIPIHAARAGGNIDLIGEFELGLRRLPNEKFEVSIEPKRIHQLGLYASVLNLLGMGSVVSMAMARKQIFIFDFANLEARNAYFDMITYGQLPTVKDIEIYERDHGPEYLLTEFRAQNENLASRGIVRNYLEKVSISTVKTHIGLDAPLVPAIVDVVNKIDEKTRAREERLNVEFVGIDREFMHSHAQSVATNGIISVSRNTFGGRKSEGQGFSGRYNEDIFVTQSRIHAIDAAHAHEFVGNKWRFNSLLVHAQLEDTKITGDQENEMAEKIDRLFRLYIGSFDYKNSKMPRVIILEREFTQRDFDLLTHPECRDRIASASQITDISVFELNALLDSLKNKHLDHQGLIVGHFIENNRGLNAFAALHQLLGAKPEDLVIRTESGYAQAVLDAKKFIAQFSKVDATEHGPVVNLVPLKTKKNTKHVRQFFEQARAQLHEIDKQLRLLYDDKYLLDEHSALNNIYGQLKVKDLIEKGVRQDKSSFKTALISARQTIRELANLDGFSQDERMLLYKMAEEKPFKTKKTRRKKRLRLKDRVVILLAEYERVPLRDDMEREYLSDRLTRTWKAIAKINDQLSRLENDQVMEIMDPEYVDNLYHEFMELRQRLAESVAFDHLSQDQIKNINTILQDRETIRARLLRQKPQDLRIDDALASAYQAAVSGRSLDGCGFYGRLPPDMDGDDGQENRLRVKRKYPPRQARLKIYVDSGFLDDRTSKPKTRTDAPFR